MAHHNSTPQSVLDAPILTRRQVRPAFVGDVERDLLGVTVGTSRKGRKVRR